MSSPSTDSVFASGTGSVHSHIHAHVASLLESGMYSDLTLRCEGKHIKVHKVFVCTKSKPIAAAMSGRHQTCEPGVFELLDDEFEIAQMMVKFLYTGTYAPTPPVTAAAIAANNLNIPPHPDDLASIRHEERQAVRSLKVYIMGDKYDIQDMKTFAKKDVERRIKACSVDCLIQILKMLYLELPPSDVDLKVAVVKFVCAGSFIDEFLDSATFKELCDEIGQVGFDIMKESRRQIKQKEKKLSKEQKLHDARRKGHKTVNPFFYLVTCNSCGGQQTCIDRGEGERKIKSGDYECCYCDAPFLV